MKESTRKHLLELMQEIALCGENDVKAKYKLALYLNEVNSDMANFAADEYKEAIELLKLAESTRSRWMAAAVHIKPDELVDYLNVSGETSDIIFTFEHICELSRLTSTQRPKVLKKWKALSGDEQALKPFAKMVSDIISPPVEKDPPELTPIKAIGKFNKQATSLGELLDDMSRLDFTEVPDTKADSLEELTQNLLYVEMKLHEIASQLGVDLTAESLDDEDEADEEEVEKEAEYEAEKPAQKPAKVAKPVKATKAKATEKPAAAPTLALKKVTPAKSIKQNASAPAATLAEATRNAATGPAKDKRRGRSKPANA